MGKSGRDEYRAAPAIFKSLIEQIFGESDLISVDDGQGGTDQIIFSGDIQGIASYTAQLEHHRALMQLNFYYNLLSYDFLEEIDARSLQVDNKQLDEIVFEIEHYLNNANGGWGHDFDSETFGHYDGDECAIECTIIMEFEPLFSDAEDANLMLMIKTIDNRIKREILDYA